MLRQNVAFSIKSQTFDQILSVSLRLHARTEMNDFYNIKS